MKRSLVGAKNIKLVHPNDPNANPVMPKRLKMPLLVLCLVNQLVFYSTSRATRRQFSRWLCWQPNAAF
jgi:hypothetical protein